VRFLEAGAGDEAAASIMIFPLFNEILTPPTMKSLSHLAQFRR
jgi:hypothetical protein